MFTSRRQVLIEWGDCDPAKIVFYPRYFEWFDASTAHHFAAAGVSKPDLIDRYGIVGFPLLDARARFIAPSSFGDEVTIETTFTKLGRSSFDVHHRLLRGDELAVEGFEKRVLVTKSPDGKGIKSYPIPDDVRAMLERSRP